MLGLSLAACSGESKGYNLEEVYQEDEEKDKPDKPHETLPPFTVESRASSSDSWQTYKAYTVDCIEGFTPGKDPKTDKYGGWKVQQFPATGCFYSTKKDGRWWIVTPDGNPYISKGVAVFSAGATQRQRNAVTSKYGSQTAWAAGEINMLHENGFNSLGAWSSVSTVKGLSQPMPYTVIISPMSSYIKYLKAEKKETEGFNKAGWEGYPYDFAMVFDEKFDSYVSSELASAALYASDPYCLGYFIDNEIPWKDYAIDRCLQKWPATHINHIKAQEWLDARKGRTGCTLSDVNDEDRKEFIAYCFGVYAEKVTKTLKKYDPNHMCLGCRFNQWNYELKNECIFRVAGQYFDVISVNHYKKWEPDQTVLANWEKWSGKPCMVTEFYTKGMDSGMLNASGAGWQVKTQNDRGLFYENFVIGLVRSRVCVGWHWFTYMDNDPSNDGADSSNTDSNKGIVTCDLERYGEVLTHMSAINENIYQLIKFYDE